MWADVIQVHPLGWEMLCMLLTGALVAVVAFWLGRLAGSPSPSPPPPEILADIHETPFDPFVTGSAGEKRAGARRKGAAVEVHLSVADQPGPPRTGWVRDRSTGGVRLVVEERFPEGTHLRIRPRQVPPGAPWVDIEVKSCQEDGVCYQIGCAYLQAPNWSVQMLFG